MKLTAKILVMASMAFGLMACDEKKTVPAPMPKKDVVQKVQQAISDGELSQGEVSVNKRVFFKNLKDGDTVTSPFLVEFGVEGMTVQKAGEVVENTGHHHLLINVDSLDLSKSVPSDENHIHFGGGQINTTVTLPAGKHKLTLLFANGVHVPHNPPLMTSINIEVK